VSATGGILDGQPGGNLLGCLLLMRMGNVVNMETMRSIANELVRLEEFPRGDGVNPSTWVVAFGTGRGTCKLTYDTREAAEGMETALKRLVWQAMGRGQALCVRRDERG
jgi:hypothetical protein